MTRFGRVLLASFWLPLALAPFAWGADDHGSEPTPFAATLIDPHDLELRGSLETPDDADCFLFEAVEGANYAFETRQLTGEIDTLLVLFDRNSRTVLAADDDGGQGRASKLAWEAPADGFYFVCVRNSRSAGERSGDYTLRASTDAPERPETAEPPGRPPSPASPPEEDDDDDETADDPQTPPADRDDPPAPPGGDPPRTEDPVQPPDGQGRVSAAGAVGILGADDAASLSDVAGYLARELDFLTLEVIDVSSHTPSASELNAFAAVLVWADSGFADAEALGDRLADYADRGGGVVVAAVSFDAPDPFDPDTLGGRFFSGGYYAIEPGVNNVIGERRVLGSVGDPAHPLMRGVAKIDGGPRTHYSPTTALSAGARALASWDDGSALAAVKTLNGARRADVNLFPPSSRVNPDLWPFTLDNDVPRLFANALLWTGDIAPPEDATSSNGAPAILEVSPRRLGFAAELERAAPDPQSITLQNAGGRALSWTASADAGWLRLGREGGELAPGASATLNVSVDPSGLAADTYNGTVTITALDAQNSPARAFVTLALAAPGATPSTPGEDPTEPPSSSTTPPGDGDAGPPLRAPSATASNPGTLGGLIRVPEQVPTLNQAVAQASSGATIELAPGTYRNVAAVVTRALTIRGGVNPAQVVLVGNGAEPVLTVAGNANPVLLEGVTLKGGGHGLLIGDRARVTVQNAFVQENVGWGVGLGQSAEVTLRNNTIFANGAGGVRVGFDGAREETAVASISRNTIENNAGCGVAVKGLEPGLRVNGRENRMTNNAPDLCDPARKIPFGFVKNKDSDGDGVPDDQDFCPTFPGRRETDGC